MHRLPKRKPAYRVETEPTMSVDELTQKIAAEHPDHDSPRWQTWNPSDSVSVCGLSAERSYYQEIRTFITNDKEFMHKDIGLKELGIKIERLMQTLVVFGAVLFALLVVGLLSLG